MLRKLLTCDSRSFGTVDKMDRYKNACRICIKEEGIKIPIFGEEGQYRGVAAKIKACLNIPIYPTDPLPKQICNKCFYKLELAAEVKEQCKRTNAVFIHHLSSHRASAAARDYLSLVQERPQQMPPPQQLQGQKRKLPDNFQSSEGPQQKRADLERQPAVAFPKARGSAPNHVAVLPRCDALSRTRSSGASPQIASTSATPPMIYTCQICDKTSVSKKLIVEHERREHTTQEFKDQGIPLGEYVCGICGRHFEQAKSLKMHSIKYHKIRLRDVTPSKMSGESSCTPNSMLGIKLEPEEMPNHECSICFLICADEASLQEHFACSHKEISSPSTPSVEDVSLSDDHPLTKPECVFCFQNFKSNGGLINHLRTSHGKPSCVICLEIFSTQEELLSHRAIHKYPVSTPTPKKASEEATESMDHVIPKAYTCGKCGKSFDKPNSFARHKASHTRRGPLWVPQDILAAQQASEALAQTSSYNGNKDPQVVDVSDSEGVKINRPSFSISTLNKLKRNNTSTPYCLYCKKIFESYKKLWDHVQKIHPNNPRYKCPHSSCGRVFFGKPGYRSHLSTHKKDKAPDVIDEDAPEQSNAAPEWDDKVPKCFECSKVFSTWQNARRHFFEKHKDTPHYQCLQCRRVFASQQILRQHMIQTHKETAAPIRKVQQNTKVETHKKMVNGKLKTYVYPKVLCRYCPKYLTKKYMYEHEKVHRKAGSRPLVRVSVPTSGDDLKTEQEQEDEDSVTITNDTPPSHNQDILKKKKKAICKYCDAVFATFEPLASHLDNKHPGKTYLLCEQCPEVYYDSVALKSHSSCHRRSYKKCSYCERTFAYHNYLKVHEKTCSARRKPGPLSKTRPAAAAAAGKVKDTSTPIYTCDFCGAQFLETQLFVKHLQGHAAAM